MREDLIRHLSEFPMGKNYREIMAIINEDMELLIKKLCKNVYGLDWSHDLYIGLREKLASNLQHLKLAPEDMENVVHILGFYPRLSSACV